MSDNEIDILRLENEELKLKLAECMAFNDDLKQKISSAETKNKAFIEIRNQAEAFLISSLEFEKLSLVAQKTSNSILILDNKGNIEWVNKGFEVLYDFSEEETNAILGINYIEFCHNADAFEAISEVLQSKLTTSLYNIYTKKDGSKLYIHTNLSPNTDEEGNIKNIIIVETNISSQKEAEFAIMQKNEEIEAQRNAISKQNELIRKQNESMKSSILYAFTIQQASLPKKELIDNCFENFIIYRPKDIVSGDFYWVYPLGPTKIIVAVADCTGHGVPGGFMSMISLQILNKIVVQSLVTVPNVILELLDQEIQLALRQKETGNLDGMDVALCLLNYEEDNNVRITYSGSRRPLFFYSKNENDIYSLSGDKRGIGGSVFNPLQNQFINKEVNLKKEDIIYLTSDGIGDQNNIIGERFGNERLTNILRGNATKTMSKQRLALELAIEQFQQDEPQCDDITIFGIKL